MHFYIQISFFIIILIILLFSFENYILKNNINLHKYWYPQYYKCKPFNKNNNIHKTNIQIGKKIAQHSKIVICLLTRNDSKNFYCSLQRILNIAHKFNQYKILVFENDSNDNTRNLFQNASKKNKNIILLHCCDLGTCDCKLKTKHGYQDGTFSQKRINKMAIYRQRYLHYIQKYLSHYHYMLVIDFDLDGNINIEGLYDNLTHKNWSAIFLNGQVQIPFTYGLKTIPYDGLAYIDIKDKYILSKSGNSIYNLYNLFRNCINMYSKLNQKNTNNLVPVKSAFNGYGLYKIKDILKCNYLGNLKCEHSNLAQCIQNNNGKLYINKKWVGYFPYQGSQSISDYFRT